MKLTITDITTDGRGLGRTTEGRVVMVPGTLPGDTIEVAVDETTSKSRSLNAKLIRLIDQSNDRVDHLCSHYASNTTTGSTAGCRGSSLGAYDYAKQLEWKQKQLTETLRRIGGLADPPIADIVPSLRTWGYRDRLELRLVRDRTGWNFIYGVENEPVIIDNCLLPLATIQNTIQKLRSAIDRLDSIKHQFENPLRLLIRDNGNGGTVVVIFSEIMLENADLNVVELWLESGETAGFQVIYSPVVGSRFLAGKSLLKSGDCVVSIPYGKTHVKIDPRVFAQANVFMRDILLHKVITLVPTTDSLIDLYGGYGFFALKNSQNGGKAVVIEESRLALRAGNEFAELNKLAVKYIQADLKHIHAIKGHLTGDTFIVDPPRSGLSDNLRTFINNRGADKLIYVSCHIAALARDMKFLTNYRPIQILPIDMFPQTPDLETVAVLEKMA